MSERLVIESFAAVAAATPKAIAVFWGGKKVSYAELQTHIISYASTLHTDIGIRKGDRVGILLKNCPEFIYALYGALMTGAVVVPINNFLKAPEIQHIATDADLKCLITSSDFDEITHVLQGPSIVALAQLEKPATAHGIVWPAVDPTDLALIIYTSGTTGKSKGAMLSHCNIASNVHSCICELDGTANDRLVLLLPMFHSFMLTVCIFTPLSLGAGIVLVKSVQPFKQAMKEIIRSRATILVGIPQLFQAMAQADVPFWLHWLLRLRLAISGAAPLAGETLTAFGRKYWFPLIEGYGLSEASPVVSLNPIHGVRKPGSVGRPIADVEVKILDNKGRELSTGEVGEIVVRGPNVMVGYFNQPEATAEALRHGWLYTGDLGRKDEDGYAYIIDRSKDMLLVRGMNVYPREVEEVIYQFDNVKEAAVVARPDEKRGEAPVAFVVPVEGAKLQADEIQRFCRERLADYKLPREIRIVDELPHTATGKIAKLELKKLLE
jgi:long-chain acyl-CoA synthetase